MAVGVAIKSDGKQYNGKITRFVLLSCMIAASGGIIFGYDVGVSGSLFLTLRLRCYDHIHDVFGFLYVSFCFLCID